MVTNYASYLTEIKTHLNFALLKKIAEPSFTVTNCSSEFSDSVSLFPEQSE